MKSAPAQAAGNKDVRIRERSIAYANLEGVTCQTSPGAQRRTPGEVGQHRFGANTSWAKPTGKLQQTAAASPQL
jgi:hypothetical protein